MASVGTLLLAASFPAYLLLSSSRSLWRTQFLSGLGASLILGSLISLVALPLSIVTGRLRWLHTAFVLVAASLVVYTGTQRSLERGASHREIWVRHRKALAEVVNAVPRVKAGTIIVLVNVPKAREPFGDNMWFDIALRLAYPGTWVAGFYYHDDGAIGGGHSFQLQDGQWVAGTTGFPSLFEKTAADHMVVVEYGENHGQVLQQMPPMICGPHCDQVNYRPNDQILAGPPSPRAINRYGPL